MLMYVPALPPLTPHGRARVRELAGLLEQPATGSRPGAAPELVRLSGLARSLKAADIQPDAVFRDELRLRLLREDALAHPARPVRRVLPPRQAGEPGRARRTGPREIRIPVRRLPALAGAVALVVAACMALVAISSNALPGDRLYGLKLRVEQARLALEPDDAARGQALLGFARTRLGEAERLLSRQSGGASAPGTVPLDRIDVALAGLQRQADQGGTLLLRSFRTEPRREELVGLSGFLTDAGPRVTALEPRLPPGASAQALGVERTLAELASGLDAAVRSCGQSCASIPVPALRGAGQPPDAGGRGHGTAGPSAAGPGAGTRPTAGASGGGGSGAAAGSAGSERSGGGTGRSSGGAAVSIGTRGATASVAPLPSVSAGLSAGSGGVSVGASLPVGSAGVSIGPSPADSVCVSISIIHAC